MSSAVASSRDSPGGSRFSLQGQQVSTVQGLWYYSLPIAGWALASAQPLVRQTYKNGVTPVRAGRGSLHSAVMDASTKKRKNNPILMATSMLLLLLTITTTLEFIPIHRHRPKTTPPPTSPSGVYQSQLVLRVCRLRPSREAGRVLARSRGLHRSRAQHYAYC